MSTKKIVSEDFVLKINQGDLSEVTYMARPLVQATLPHKAPPDDLPMWSRKNGNLILSIRPGWNVHNNTSYGYPYGIIPRLLLFWLTTESLKTNSRKLELGSSLSEFMRQLGLNPASGTGERSDAKRLKNQMERLFRATIGFELQNDDHRKNMTWLDMQIAPMGELWWNANLDSNGNLFNSWVELGEKFFLSIIEHPIPLDMNVLQAIRNSPLALDLYAWATYKTFAQHLKQKDFHVTWAELNQQFGSGYSRIIDFRRKATDALSKVCKVYSGLKIEESDTGLILSPGSPSVKPRQPKLVNYKKIDRKRLIAKK